MQGKPTQNRPIVKSRQIYVCRISIDGKRQRVRGDFPTVMLLVRMALGQRAGRA